MRNTLLFICIISVILSVFSFAFAEEENAAGIRQGDILCFGEPDEACGFDGKWLVLDAQHTNTGEDGIFLVSLNLIGDEQGNTLIYRQLEEDVSVSFSDRGEEYAASHPGVLDYQGSDLQQWCGEFLSKHFSEAEQQAILQTTKSDKAIVIPGFGIPLPGAKAGTVDFDPAENVLSGDKLFPLSVEEVTNEQYGFSDNRSRVALYKGEAQGYWLRSPHIATFPLDVGFVFSFGSVMDFAVNTKTMFAQDTYARLACNLNSDAISSLEALSSTDGKIIWRVSFEGEGNTRDYDLSLPVVGKVMDLNSMIKIVFYAVLFLTAALLVLIIWLITRAVRRKSGKKQRTA
jgi:hypothetical protein